MYYRWCFLSTRHSRTVMQKECPVFSVDWGFGKGTHVEAMVSWEP